MYVTKKKKNFQRKFILKILYPLAPIATAQVVLDLLKAIVILSDTTVRRFVVNQEDLKPYWKSEKRLHLSR